MVGEDLNTACFKSHMESVGPSAEILLRAGSDRPLPVTTGRQKGPRLDRWIRVDWQDGSKTVFQTEIKNWSAHAFGGSVLPVEATRKEVKDYKQTRWERHWDRRRRVLKHPETKKVLVSMKPPGGVEPKIVRPLLIFWEAIGPRSQAGKHLFKVALPKTFEFPELWVFSVSSYLRSVLGTNTEDSIELEMSASAARLRILNRLFSTDT